MNIRRSLQNLVADTDTAFIKRGWASDHEHPEPWNWDYLGIRWMHQYLAVSPPAPARVVLDIGAGPGPFRAHIHATEQYLSLDIAPQPGITLLADGQRLPLCDRSVDLVVSFQVLEHVARPDLVVDEIRRVLRPQGQILLSLPGVWPYHGHDYWRWTHEGLQQLFAGFADVGITPVSGPLCLSAVLLGYVARDLAARSSNKTARIAGRLLVAGGTLALNSAAAAAEQALRRSRAYSQLREDCTDVYFVRATKPG